MPSITERLDLLKETIQRKDFLKGEGLSNEVNIRMFCYESKEEMAGTTSEKVKLSKQLKKINEQLLELNKYEEIVHHWADKMEPMDLDDGVKVNYAKFQELLAKIK